MKKIAIMALLAAAGLFLAQQLITTNDATRSIGIVVPVEHQAMDEMTRGFREVVSAKYGDTVRIDILNAQGDPNIQKSILELFKQHNYAVVAVIGKEVATLTQNLQMATFGDLSVSENYLCAAMKKSSPPPNLDDLANYHPALPNKLDTPVKNLSGGERQCLALAMCLLHPPKLLLLDEHTSALDPKIGKEIMEKTYALVKGQVTTIMATHRLDDALTYGNRLIVMKEGKIAHQFDSEAKRSLTKEDLLRLY